jgi:hypothetical protein
MASFLCGRCGNRGERRPTDPCLGCALAWFAYPRPQLQKAADQGAILALRATDPDVLPAEIRERAPWQRDFDRLAKYTTPGPVERAQTPATSLPSPADAERLARFHALQKPAPAAEPEKKPEGWKKDRFELIELE